MFKCLNFFFCRLYLKEIPYKIHKAEPDYFLTGVESNFLEIKFPQNSIVDRENNTLSSYGFLKTAILKKIMIAPGILLWSILSCAGEHGWCELPNIYILA